MNLVLDFGHGGSKPGAVYRGAVEKDLNLWTGQRVYQYLHAKKGGMPLRVLLTRDADYHIPLRARYELINQCHQEYDLSLVISLHYNAATSTEVNGFEIYYEAGKPSALRAAKCIVGAVADDGIVLNGDGITTTAALGRELAMIHRPVPPAILIEFGYLTHDVDRRNALNEAYRDRLASATAVGILQYLKKKREVRSE